MYFEVDTFGQHMHVGIGVFGHIDGPPDRQRDVDRQAWKLK